MIQIAFENGKASVFLYLHFGIWMSRLTFHPGAPNVGAVFTSNPFKAGAVALKREARREVLAP